jgi:hypothetical protein
MRAAFFSLIAASLLVHATFGSCLHHDCDASTCSEAALVLESAHECDHDCCDAHKGHDSQRPQPHSHCRGTCNYLPAKHTQFNKCALSVQVDFAWGASAVNLLHMTDLRYAGSIDDLVLHPPLRLHLLNQILLI